MNPRHQELFQTLIELYTLQIQLGNIPATWLKIPEDPVFNRDAALQAGYTEEAVNVMAGMPYLSRDGSGFELFPSTCVERYVDDPHQDIVFYECLRELDTNPDEEVYLPPSFLKITNQNVYGHTFLYDADTALVREWRPFYDGIDKDNQDFDSLAARPPAEAFREWINSYRQLKVFRYSDIDVCWQPDAPFLTRPPVVVEAEENLRQAELKIRDLYLQNGWDVNSKEQDAFNLQTFLEQRDAHNGQVIDPLREKISEAYKIADEQKRQEDLRRIP